MMGEGKFDINGRNIGVVGDNAHVENLTQSSSESGGDSLAAELEKLRREMAARAEEREHYEALSAVRAAEDEAKKGDEGKAMEYLRKAGTWGLDVATKIGVPLAVEAIKRHMGP